MRTTLRVRVLFLLTMLVAAAGAWGAIPTKAGPQQKFAMVVGADPSGEVSRQQKVLLSLLTEHYGYDDANVIQLFDGDATIDGIRERARSLRERMTPRDSLFMFVSLPSVRTPDGLAGIPYGSSPERPWSLLTAKDFAEWFKGLRARSVFAILPACSEGRDAYVLRELLYASGAATALDILTLCDESTATGAKTASALENMLRDAGEGLDAREILAALRSESKGYLQQAAANASFNQGFAFVRTQDRLRSVLTAAASAESSEVRIAAIQSIVKSIQQEPQAGREPLVAEAAPVLIEAAGDDDRAVRLTAVWALGEIRYAAGVESLVARFPVSDPQEKRAILDVVARLGGPSATELVRAALSDADQSVRAEAVRAATLVQDDTFPARLLEVGRTDDSPAVRVAVLQVIPEIRTVSPDAVAELAREGFAHPDASLRRQAVGTWVDLGRSAFTEQLVKMLRDEMQDPGLRQTLAYALGRNVDPATAEQVVSELVAVLRSPTQVAVREAAAFSLGKVGGREAEKALVRVVENDREPPALLVVAAEALGTIKTTRVFALGSLLRHKDPAVRRAAVRAIGESGGSQALQLLFGTLTDGDANVRSEAAAALEKMSPGASSRGPVLAKLRDPAAAVRAEAAEKLVAYPAPDVANRLVEQLVDPDPRVRDAIVKTLSTFRSEELVMPVIRALDSLEPTVQHSAIRVVRALGRRDQIEKLTKISDRDNTSGVVRAEAVRTLADFKAPLEVFIDAADERDPLVRQAAAEALGAFPVDEAVNRLKKLSLDDVALVRDAAITALRQLAPSARKD